RIGFERRALRGVETARGFDQADHAGLLQIVHVHARRQARDQVMRDARDQFGVARHDLARRLTLHGAVFGVRQRVHAIAPGALTRRSTKNSTLPRGPLGADHCSTRRAIACSACAEAQAGYASTTACWRWIARRSQSSYGIALNRFTVTSRKRSVTR